MSDGRIRTRVTALPAVFAAAGWVGVGHAETFCIDDLSRRATALAQSLIGGPPAPYDEIIVPRSNIDPQMAVMPPGSGTIWVITPRDVPRRRP